ncbi:unnamed protein product [Caenorhabditis angaria]|uniref:Uncharacterized protein n=1 Tax=Caenorhabditis angaria TaxID=860376 RepID=A0A9P1I7Q7_9PELO|nr:unnamed protein product [Caenorhabditis angaria]
MANNVYRPYREGNGLVAEEIEQLIHDIEVLRARRDPARYPHIIQEQQQRLQQMRASQISEAEDGSEEQNLRRLPVARQAPAVNAAANEDLSSEEENPQENQQQQGENQGNQQVPVENPNRNVRVIVVDQNGQREYLADEDEEAQDVAARYNW